MEKVEHGIKELIASTHEKEEGPGGVVKTKQRIFLFSYILM